MAFWYLKRQGLEFSLFWFKYGELPDGVSQDYVNQKLVEASSVYFVNLVVM
jgi:sodium/potassium-transporting ATPase subunit alpha